MRVPTLQTSTGQFDTVTARQAQLAQLQSQVASGLAVQSPGDDPVAAAQAEKARSRQSALAREHRALSLATTALTSAESALGQGIDLLQSARETLILAGNASYSDAERRALAATLRSTREQLLGVANAQDGAGGFVFGGQGATQAPFGGGSLPSWAAMAGEQSVATGARHAATVDGRSTFMALPRGNGVFVTSAAAGNTGSGWIDPGSVSDPAQLKGHAYRITISGAPGALTYTVNDTTSGTQVATGAAFVAGQAIVIEGQRVTIDGQPAAGDSFDIGPAGQQSIFQTLDEAVALLESQGLDRSAYSGRLQAVQATLDRALEGMTLVRSRVGEDMRRLDQAVAAGEQEDITLAARRSDLQDVDLAQAVSRLQAGQTGLEAALRAYAGSRLNLFELLS